MKSSVDIEGGKVKRFSLCGDECESVSHVLWECSTYSNNRASFMKKASRVVKR